MSIRDELTDLIGGAIDAVLQSAGPEDEFWEAAGAVLDAGYRKTCVITTVDELSPMPDGTVIIGPDGLVGEKRDWPLDLAVRYVDGSQETNADIPMPVTVIYVPEESK